MTMPRMPFLLGTSSAGSLCRRPNTSLPGWCCCVGVGASRIGGRSHPVLRRIVARMDCILPYNAVTGEIRHLGLCFGYSQYMLYKKQRRNYLPLRVRN